MGQQADAERRAAGGRRGGDEQAVAPERGWRSWCDVGSTGSDPDPLSWRKTRPVSPSRCSLSVQRGGAGTLGAQIEAQLRGRSARAAAAGHAGAVDARPRPPARRVAADRRRRLRAARGRGLPERSPGRAPARSDPAPGAAPRGDGARRRRARPLRLPARARPTSRRSRAPRGCARCAPALATMTDADLGYGDPRGADGCARRSPTTSAACAASSPTPARVVVTSGYSQGLGLFCRVLAERGARAARARGPVRPRDHVIVARARARARPGAVDADGMRRRRAARPASTPWS